MTYLSFHLVFILPVIAVLAVIHLRQAVRLDRQAWAMLALMSGVAFIYTTPWDNYLVYRGVWGYGSERVLGTLGYVPLEEYAFFLLQPILTGLWYFLLRARARRSTTPPPRWLRPSATAFWLLLTATGVIMLMSMSTHWTYMGLILAWCSPVLAGLSWLGTSHVWRDRRAVALGVAVPTVYLWIADRTAIDFGIWTIADTYSVGFDPVGLPIEEALFFFVTNLLVVQGLAMLLPDASQTE